MAGFYKLSEKDVDGMTLMLSHMQGPSFDKRCRMALCCLANTWKDEERCDVPFFSIGARTLAEKLGVSYKSCRSWFELMERDGWLVRLGEETNRGGRFTMRTFFWLAEGAPKSEEKRAHPVRPKKGAPPEKGPAKSGAPVRPSGSNNRRSENRAGRTSELTEVSSEEGGSPAGAGTPPAESALAEIFRMRDDGWEPEWLK